MPALPVELWCKILASLSPSELKPLLPTCRLWLDIITSILYESLFIRVNANQYSNLRISLEYPSFEPIVIDGPDIDSQLTRHVDKVAERVKKVEVRSIRQFRLQVPPTKEEVREEELLDMVFDNLVSFVNLQSIDIYQAHVSTRRWGTLLMICSVPGGCLRSLSIRHCFWDPTLEASLSGNVHPPSNAQAQLSSVATLNLLSHLPKLTAFTLSEPDRGCPAFLLSMPNLRHLHLSHYWNDPTELMDFLLKLKSEHLDSFELAISVAGEVMQACQGIADDLPPSLKLPRLTKFRGPDVWAPHISQRGGGLTEAILWDSNLFEGFEKSITPVIGSLVDRLSKNSPRLEIITFEHRVIPKDLFDHLHKFKHLRGLRFDFTHGFESPKQLSRHVRAFIASWFSVYIYSYPQGFINALTSSMLPETLEDVQMVAYYKNDNEEETLEDKRVLNEFVQRFPRMIFAKVDTHDDLYWVYYGPDYDREHVSELGIITW